MAPPVIGVTGSIGTGKTTFCEFLAEEGGRHLNADRIAKELMAPGHDGYQPVLDEFGTDITDEEGHVQADLLAEEVFSDSEKLDRLEAILHPLVKETVEEIVSEARDRFYVVDAPLLFEAGVDDLCDHTITVTAPRVIVDGRLKERGMTVEDIEQRRERQLSAEQKAQRADVVVENDGSLEELREDARTLRERFVESNTD
jgi:dephospho-CoA kinase